ncbi:hypothetical protein PHYBOEH_000322 [Phytophthora boehmeriae]|uniref:Uncharacterized protein n=1 Tax=Phytophthora boehmeriae TaxID=109152 RepID=A0A8T1WU88_9STRA|nr:hypothetical protein PHYBOEH_000322 [Phytophthora boehmeriae]
MEQNTTSLSVAKLVAGITDAKQTDDSVRIDHLESLTSLCSTPLTDEDVALLKSLVSNTLFSGHLQATDSDEASDLHAAKWRLLSTLLAADGVEAPTSEQEIETVLSLMLADRFVSSDVLTAMAQWLIELRNRLGDAINLLDVEVLDKDGGEQSGSCLELVKQMYVTLGGNGNLRLQLAEMLGKLVDTKERAKSVVRSGILRTLLQIALEQPDEITDTVLLQNFILVGKRVASFVCYEAVASGLPKLQGNPIAEKRHEVCELVVALMLSGVSLAFAEGVRLLELLSDNAACRALLPEQELWSANQQCRAQQKSSASGGKSKTNARDERQMRDLHRQIVSAYKKLQQMHANKKRLDKKVIKQMVKYLATIPGVQDETG